MTFALHRLSTDSDSVFVFRYDIDNNGLIELDEMTKIIKVSTHSLTHWLLTSY